MVPRLNEIVKIAHIFQEELNDIDMSDAEIVFKVERDFLQKLNEDFYFRNGGTDSHVDMADEICVNVGGITFRYVPKVD